MFGVSVEAVAGAAGGMPGNYLVKRAHSGPAQGEALIHVEIGERAEIYVVGKKGLSAIERALVMQRVLQPEHEAAGGDELTIPID